MEFFLFFFIFLKSSTVLVNAEEPAKFYSAGAQKASDDYIVVLRKGISESVGIQSVTLSLTPDYGLNLQKQIDIGDFHAVVVKGGETGIQSLMNHPDVAYIEENKIIQAVDDVCWEKQVTDDYWGLIRLNRRQINPKCPHTEYTECVYQYSDNEDGRGAYVYVLDTGIRWTHDEFCNRARWGFTSSKIARVEGKTDYNGHGTHVAGIAVGHNFGVAKGAWVIAVKVLDGEGSGSGTDALEGVEWAVNDIKKNNRKAVCNLSLGGQNRLVSLENAIESAMQQGVPFVIAAGNDNMTACEFSPAALGQNTSAITVGATNIDDKLASFSNHGKCVNILAPGENITSAYPSSDAGYAMMNGTSMASPFVAGVVARYLSGQTTSPSPAAIKSWLHQQATNNSITMYQNATLSQTPNKLLYMGCDHLKFNNTPPRWCSSTSSSVSNHDFAYSIYVIVALQSVIWWIQACSSYW